MVTCILNLARVPTLTKTARCAILHEHGNIQDNKPTMEILTSGVRARSECHRRSIVNTVGHVSVTVRWEANATHSVPDQGTQQQSQSDKECRSRRAEGVQERGRRGQATLCISFRSHGSTSCRGTKPASDRRGTQVRGTVQQETQSLVMSEVPIQLKPVNPQYKDNDTE